MNEHLLLRRIGKILNVESVSGSANFFDLGGDSLAALELTELLHEEFGTEIDVQTVLAAATFDDLFRSCRMERDEPSTNARTDA